MLFFDNWSFPLLRTNLADVKNSEALLSLKLGLILYAIRSLRGPSVTTSDAARVLNFQSSHGA